MSQNPASGTYHADSEFGVTDRKGLDHERDRMFHCIGVSLTSVAKKPISYHVTCSAPHSAGHGSDVRLRWIRHKFQIDERRLN